MLESIYEFFPEIEDISVEGLYKWIKTRPETRILENFIANRLLYPGTISIEAVDLNLDLAVFREVVKRSPKKIFDRASNKITIPQDFIFQFGSIQVIVRALHDCLEIPGTTLVVVKNGSQKVVVGTVEKYF